MENFQIKFFESLIESIKIRTLKFINFFLNIYKNFLFNVNKNKRLNYMTLACPEYLSDFKYKYSPCHIYPFKRVIDANAFDLIKNEYKFSKDNLETLRNFGTLENNVSLKDVILFCDLEFTTENITMKKIDSSGIKHIQLNKDKNYIIVE